MDIIMGIGIALPVVSSVAIGTVTGVAQGVSEQKRVNADQSNAARLLKFHVDVRAESASCEKDAAWLNGGIVTLHDGKMWVERKSTATMQPEDTSRHPFTGFYLAYPDDNRPYTRGLVSTISRDPPMLNWIYIDNDTQELKYANRSGSIEHHVGSYDWTGEQNNSSITYDEWEGFVAVEEPGGGWAIYFDLHDDGLQGKIQGRRSVEINMDRRVITDQELNKWGLNQEGNIGFRKTREV